MVILVRLLRGKIQFAGSQKDITSYAIKAAIKEVESVHLVPIFVKLIIIIILTNHDFLKILYKFM